MIALAKARAKTLPPGSRIRVLVVDDSVVIRRLVTHALAEDKDIEVVGAASNGVLALHRIAQLKPDALTLDIEMPEMDGLTALKRIRELYPDMPVIMFSTLTERGATATLDALTLGANDYVTKAANVGSLEKSMASLRSELVPKIKQFFQIGTATPLTPVPPVRTQVAPSTVGPQVAGSIPPAVTVPRIIAIGSSTGGPNALADVMQMFPKDFPLPIVIVQHMPPVFTRLLAERLNTVSELPVEEVTQGRRVEPGVALVAAGGLHMRVARAGKDVIATTDEDPPENSCRPAVDVLFRSVAEVYGAASVAVVLTGMGSDGMRGAEVLKANGARVVVQDEASSVVWGMPGAVVKAGLADNILDLKAVVPEILKHL